MTEKIPENQFFDDFYIWLNPRDKEEYYATSLYFYKAHQNIDYDKKRVTVVLEKDINKARPKNEKTYKFPALKTYPYAERLGMFLLNFLNTDFSTFENAYNTFFCYYGFDILRSIYIDMPLEYSYETEKEFLVHMKDNFECCEDKLLDYQEEYKKCVDYVFNISDKENLKGYKVNTRYMVYLIKHIGNVHNYCRDITIIKDDFFEQHLEFQKSSEQELLEKVETEGAWTSINDICKSNNISNICYFILEELVKTENNPIKQCKNCGKYFIPTSRVDEIYCEYPREDGTTCKEIGAKVTYRNNIKNNKALQEYNKSYQQKLMAVLRNKGNKELKADFEKWKKLAREQTKLLKENKKTEDEVYEWMQNNK